ncbi:MAG: DUF4416 family protein [Candidatus Omnitrophota bacterium]|nr:DUF4416 family protein [Candidatus Omnitrophota bacterium]
MAVIKHHKQVKLICGLIGKSEDTFKRACRVLSKRFGKIDFKSRLIEFDHTAYYQRELGTGLKRQFLSFQRLIKPELLPGIKIITNRLEKKSLPSFKDRNRWINIDPGYITEAKLILATTRNYQHRIYLSKGIYAEVTLRFASGSFQPHEWTYPDYKSEEYAIIFNQIRKIYLTNLQ